MNEKLFMFIHCLKLHQIIHDTTASTHQQVGLLAKRIPRAPGLSLAVNSLQL